MFIKYKLKTRVIEKLRLVYNTGYIHEMWVYNLKIDKQGQYTWSHYKNSNRIIDLQPENIISIFVVKRKKVLYWSRIRKRKIKPSVVLDMFKPKKVTPMSMRTGVEHKKLYDNVEIKDEIQMVFTKGLDDNKFGY
jgi:hypothetical protein